VSDDPRERFVSALARGLRCGPLRRRRVIREITAHLDDTVTELEAGGMPEDAAVQEALRRIGDVGSITSAFLEARPQRRRLAVRGLRSPAWVAVGAMTLVTALAAELPPASGAKPRAPAHSVIDSRHIARSSEREHRGGRARRPGRASRPGRR
jgi:hypothetical protein